MPQIFIITLSLLPWIPAFLCGVTTEEQFSVLEGRSLIIPCHYEPQYASYVKYWCRGKTREFCTSLARTDETHAANAAVDKVSIVDDPVQLVFTVFMTDLKVDDSGWYSCGVEIGGAWRADAVAYTNLKVINGMLMVNNRLRGEEGGSVVAECLYSERYRESEKKWCRSGDWSSCLSTGSKGSYEDTSVTIRDDRTGAFTVTLKKLRMKDAGWHWCSAGQQQVSVHLLVTPQPTTTSVSMTAPPEQSTVAADQPPPKAISTWNRHSHIFESLLVCASVMLLVGLAVLARKLWKRSQQNPRLRQVKEMEARLSEYSADVGDLQNTSFSLTRTQMSTCTELDQRLVFCPPSKRM